MVWTHLRCFIEKNILGELATFAKKKKKAFSKICMLLHLISIKALRDLSEAKV